MTIGGMVDGEHGKSNVYLVKMDIRRFLFRVSRDIWRRLSRVHKASKPLEEMVVKWILEEEIPIPDTNIVLQDIKRISIHGLILKASCCRWFSARHLNKYLVGIIHHSVAWWLAVWRT